MGKFLTNDQSYRLMDVRRIWGKPVAIGKCLAGKRTVPLKVRFSANVIFAEQDDGNLPQMNTSERD